MAKEEKILTVRSKLNDRDFEDVFKIYLETERTKDRSIGLIGGGALCLVCLILLLIFRNITFVFYALGCLIVAAAYWLVPVNKKFIANNKLQFGEWRETSFFPHSITVMEIFDENESAEMDEEEIEEATTRISTVSLTAYENERGFLFAESKIINQFLYIPKRSLKKQELADIQAFAKERCSGGYHLLEMKSMIEDGEQEQEEDDSTSMTSAVCDQYYGAKKLHLYDADGRRVAMDEDEAEEALGELDAEADEALAEAHTEVMDAPDLDVEGEWERIIAEDTEAEDTAEDTEDE